MMKNKIIEKTLVAKHLKSEVEDLSRMNTLFISANESLDKDTEEILECLSILTKKLDVKTPSSKKEMFNFFYEVGKSEGKKRGYILGWDMGFQDGCEYSK